MSPKVSVIIVNYRSRDLTDQLIDRLQAGSFRNFEVIVVDNDIKNIGYGPAVNQGSNDAHGEYLYVTNPDTIPFSDTLEKLVKFLDNHPGVGLVSPILLDSNKVAYPLQGTTDLTPISAIFALSFINKYWSKNPVSKFYWLSGWKKDSDISVGVAPGTAFLIRRRAFLEVSGFDPKFFLYFEESDLCRRLRQIGWSIYIHPSSRLIHLWGKSTPDSPSIKLIFSQSRQYYFSKHFGHLWSFLVQLVVK